MHCSLFSTWGWFLGFTLLLSTMGTVAEESTAGQAVYEELCVRCHGTHGQGVAGQYEDALQGDWSVERLARRIHRTMPEDQPEQCEGEAAAAVAQYIYDAFYSPEAQLRKPPARVELVRLTNRQYENAVADLVGLFYGNADQPGDEHGLRATYYNHRDFRRDSQLEQRVDAMVEFQSTGAGLHPGNRGTNGCSVQWRGSLLADETGDYEIVLKTPNGARLWLNNDEVPLIDAGVASGALDDYSVTLRLLGGRHYPLRLDWFKSQETNASVTLGWKPPHGVKEAIPARNLFPIRSNPTLVISTPFPPDDSSVGYERGVSISKAWDEAATYAAVEVANTMVENLDRLSRSKSTDTNRNERLKAFCAEFVGLAFCRPLTTAQTADYVEAQFAQAATPEEAVKRVVLRTLKSPRFLYLGLEDAAPDDHTIASRLSFSLWDSLPDRELWKEAGRGRLHSREAVARQAGRMLADPRARSKTLNSLQHWLQVTHVESLAKDPQLFSDFTPEVAADLRTSLNLFLLDAVCSGNSDYRQLLLADYVFVNPRLAAFYGVEAPPVNDFVKMPFETAHRSGVLTHPYLLAAFAYPRSTSPIHRGVFLTRNIVGRSLNPPPIAVAFKDADFDPRMTMREKVAELTRPQACQACHSFINPLGFSLEHFDAVGRYRTEDNNRPVDAKGDYTTEDGEVVHVAGARDVAEFAAGSPDAQKAFIEQMFHQVVKQPMRAYGPDVMRHLHQSFAETGFNVQRLLAEVATLSALQNSNPLTAHNSTP